MYCFVCVCRVSQESASCTIVFVLVYYFSMAGVIWFALLAYAWHLSFRAFGSSRDVIEGRRGHFHLMAWSLPLVLTIVCLAVTQVTLAVSHLHLYLSSGGLNYGLQIVMYVHSLCACMYVVLTLTFLFRLETN